VTSYNTADQTDGWQVDNGGAWPTPKSATDSRCQTYVRKYNLNII